MKKLVFIFLALLVLSCKEELAPKPEHLLTEGDMVNILYDISILQSIKSFQPAVLDSNRVNPRTYIYSKYKIDSLIFAQNHTYYASNLEEYDKIQARVKERLKANTDKLKPKKTPKKGTTAAKRSLKKPVTK